jgi:glycosyltransferase involved in cell wall biosynthesis
VLRAFERRAVMRAVATTVVSEREKGLATSALGLSKELTVAPNGIDLGAFTPPRPPAVSQDVVFCGVFNYGPNEAAAKWLAQDVWPEVKRAQPSAKLKIVGMHPSRAVRELARPESIEVTGAVPDVRPYLWDAAVAAAPLKVARGVQNKVLEAIAAGLPCVVTPQVYGGLPTAVRGAVVQAGSSCDFARALVSLLRGDPGERRRKAMQVDLSSLSWDLQLRPLLDIVRGM